VEKAWVLRAAVVLTCGAACGGGTGPAGLDRDPIPGPGDYSRTITSDGFDRIYEIHVPPSWQPGSRLPVVLAFHGIGSGPAAMRRTTRLDEFADRLGFVAVYPKAWADWSTGCMVCGSQATLLRIDDVRFVRELLDQLDLDVGIERRRVTAIGMSNGALFVHRLACDSSNTIAGFVSVGATMLDAGSVPTCEPARAAPIVFVHGTLDGLFPPGGRAFGEGSTSYRTLSIQETVATWVTRNRCAPVPSVVDLPDLVEDGTTTRRYEYAGCADGSRVDFYEVVGGGHTWPGTAGSGPVSMDFDATEVAVDLAQRSALSRIVP
jgi:polyhydroxybutyrate depolymerase